MTTLTRFQNIKLMMHWNDHNPPHIHATYKQYKAKFNFDGEMKKGHLPRRERLAVQTWIAYNEEELAKNWQRAENGEEICTMKPLEI